jgi:hypothetical protein
VIPSNIYYLTGASGDKFSGIVECYQYGNNEIFSFRFDFSGDRFDIMKDDGLWVYCSGLINYLDSWVLELGHQIEETAKIHHTI